MRTRKQSVIPQEIFDGKKICHPERSRGTLCLPIQPDKRVPHLSAFSAERWIRESRAARGRPSAARLISLNSCYGQRFHRRETARARIDRSHGTRQVSAVVNLLEIILDPLARELASAPYDDEPVSQEEAREVEASRASLARGEGIPNEKILAEFGLSAEDFERVGLTLR